MESATYNLLTVDTAAHSLLFVNSYPSGEILAELPFSADWTPSSLAVNDKNSKAYLPVVDCNDKGKLLTVNLVSKTLYPLPLELPHPAQFSLAPDGNIAYLADPGGALYSIDTTTLTLKCWGRPENAQCNALKATPSGLLSAWELPKHGAIAGFTPLGQLAFEYHIPGIPTSIGVDSRGQILVPFTASPEDGREGLAIFNQQGGATPTIIPFHCSTCSRNFGIYPCQVVLSPDEQTVYVVNEDGGSIIMIDIDTATITSCILLGRSISNLQLLPDCRFGITTSYMFADLCLIDLVNQRLLSMTDSCREFSVPIVVLPK